MSSSPEKKTPSSLKSEASPPVEIKEAIAPANASGQRFRKRWLALIFVPLLATRFTYTRRGTSITAVPAAYMLCSENGNQIYTVEEESPTVACLGVRAGEILATGEKTFVEAVWRNSQSAAAGTEESKLPLYTIPAGHVVVPGLTDAHAHVLGWGYKMQLPLDGSDSVAEVIRRVKQYIMDRPDVLHDKSRWIEGMGWDQTKWTGQQFPTAEDLEADPVLRGRPIALKRVDVHATWVSQRAIELAKERHGGDLPKSVEGGEVVRGADGQPTGIFIDNAMDLVPIPPWTDDQMDDYFQRTMKDALEHGLTSVHDALSEPSYIKFFMKKAEQGSLPIRLYLMGNVNSDEYWGSQIPRVENHGADHRLTIRGIKLFTDGALGSFGAALLEPYSDRPDTSGILRTSPESLEKLVQQFWKDDFQVNIHCIGDKANHVVLDIFEKLVASDPTKDARPRIEHAQIMTQDDLQRVGRLGVIASVQPTHATSDMGYAEARLGPERIKGAYAYQTLLNVSHANVLPLGSDFPVEGINPLLGFYAAVSRLRPDGTSPHGSDGWFSEQKLTRAQALKGMTLDAAYASFAENRVGSLVTGKKADFVVLDQDILTVPQDQILATKVKATVIDGQVTYGAL